MPTGIRICKVCGKEYPYCKTERRTTIFRFQDVACCPEHGVIYFERVAESRAPKPAVEVRVNNGSTVSDVSVTDDNKENKTPAKSSRKKQS